MLYLVSGHVALCMVGPCSFAPQWSSAALKYGLISPNFWSKFNWGLQTYVDIRFNLGDLIARVSKPSTIDCDVATAWDGKNIPCAISNLEQLHFFFLKRFAKWNHFESTLKLINDNFESTKIGNFYSIACITRRADKLFQGIVSTIGD